MKDIKNGFTMVELLATIFIIALVFTIGGLFVFNVIESSKNTTDLLSESSIKKVVNTYIKEFPEEISWSDDTDDNKYTCVLLDLLVEKGYFEKTKLDKFEHNYIKVVKDNRDNIISEDFVADDVCSNVQVRVPIPTNEICNKFDSNEFIMQSLIDSGVNHLGYTYDEENSKGKYPGIYPVELKLKDNHIWSDGTSEVKIVNCVINKKVPVVELDNYITTDVGVETFKIKMKSNVSGDVK